MLEPSILSSVHAVEPPFPARSEIACGNPLCRARFKPSGTVNSPQRYCADSCKQQASLIRRVAYLFRELPDGQAIEILRRVT
jgi:hypothetical protein